MSVKANLYKNMLNISVYVLVAQSCPTLWDHVDCNPPGFSVHGILQARALEWVDPEIAPAALTSPALAG